MSRMQKVGIGLGIGFLSVLILVWILYAACVDFVDNYEQGYKYDLRSGKITMLDRTGYIITPPFLVKVHTVDLRPMQVCINANSRVLNCKLVQFDPKGLELFLSWHGRDDYDGPGNGGSTSGTVSTSTTTLSNILMSYAYEGSGKSYPFLKIIRELKGEEDISAAAPVPPSDTEDWKVTK